MDVDVVVILSILSVLVATLNIYCIFIIFNTKKLHKAPHMAICSLLFAHALQGLLVIPSYAIKRALDNPPSICMLFRFTYMLTNYASCMSLLVISLDRCFGVMFPLKYKIFITPQRMISCLVFSWFYILVLCLIPFLPNSSNTKKCKYLPQDEWVLTMLLGHTMLPFIIIFICYFFIFRKIRKVLHKRKVHRELTINTQSLQNQWRKSRITIAIVVFYVLCWGPGFLYYTLLTLCHACFYEGWDKTKAEQYATFAMKVLTFIDGVIAPLLYCLSNKKFVFAKNRLFKQIKLKFFHEKNNQITYTPTLRNKHLDISRGRRNDRSSNRSSIISDLSVTWNDDFSSTSDYVPDNKSSTINKRKYKHGMEISIHQINLRGYKL